MASNLIEVKPIGSNSFTALPCPSKYRMTSTSIVDGSRNSKGKMIGTIVREGIRKIEIEWNFLSVANFSLVAKLFEGADTGGNGNFSCYTKYFDSVIGDFINSESGFTTLNNVVKGTTDPREFYVGDRITDTAQITLDKITGMPIGYSNVKLSLIEK